MQNDLLDRQLSSKCTSDIDRAAPCDYVQRLVLRLSRPDEKTDELTDPKAFNLFAGVAIMFYGYDQGVMSQVNLTGDYGKLEFYAAR